MLNPGINRIRRDAEVNDTAGKFYDKESIDRTKEEVDDGKEVTRPHVFRVVFEEGRPALRRRLGWMNPSNVFLNGAFRDAEAEFEEFPMDAFCTLINDFLRPCAESRRWSR